MKNNKNNQTGISLFSLLFVLTIIVFFTSIVIKTAPTYLENFSIKSSLASIADEINSEKIKPAEIKEKLIKRLKFNSVNRIAKENIKIAGGEEDSTLSVDYEVRTPFIGNIDFVMSFNNSEVIKL